MRDLRDFGGQELRERLCYSIVSWFRGFAKVGPKSGNCEGSAVQDVNKICITPARESDFKVKIVKNWQVRNTFGS